MSKEVATTTSNALSNVIDFSNLGEELAGLSLRFDRIKIPAGGGIVFEVPGDDPESPDTEKFFNGVIVYQHPANVYYRDKFDGGNAQPDCSSLDGIKGIDRAGEIHICEDCPMNKFGSGENGAKACKQKRRLFILREGEALPIILVVPTGSLKDYSTYVTRLLSKGKRPSGVITRFSLRKATNSTGIVYSQLVCALERDLSAEESAIVSKLVQQVKEFAIRVDTGIADDDTEVVDTVAAETKIPPKMTETYEAPIFDSVAEMRHSAHPYK